MGMGFALSYPRRFWIGGATASMTRPAVPMTTDQRYAGFSRADQRMYRKGPLKKAGVGLAIVTLVNVLSEVRLASGREVEGVCRGGGAGRMMKYLAGAWGMADLLNWHSGMPKRRGDVQGCVSCEMEASGSVKLEARLAMAVHPKWPVRRRPGQHLAGLRGQLPDSRRKLPHTFRYVHNSWHLRDTYARLQAKGVEALLQLRP